MTFEEALENLYWSVLADDPEQLQEAINKAEEVLGFNFRTYREEELNG